MMKTNTKFRFSFYSAIVCLLLFAVSCSSNSYDNREQAENFLDKQTAGAVSAETKIVDEMDRGSGELPKRFQNPSFLLEKEGAFTNSTAFSVPVGADISSNRGPVTLRDILKRLAVLKQMNVSWAEDVDQKALVDVDIRAEDDYYKSIENILRQLDYFYEIEGNSIVVKYRDTQTFHLAMPFLKQAYNSGVGGDVLGSAGTDDSKKKEHKMKGLIELLAEGASEDSFNIWANVEMNLKALLEMSEATEVQDSVDINADPALERPNVEEVSVVPEVTTQQRVNNRGALGYYMIDRPVGLITVTAPRTILTRVESYIESLKKVVYRQISIEAKIVEVTLSGDNRTGIDWSALLGGTLESAWTGSVDFQQANPNYKTNIVDARSKAYYPDLMGVSGMMAGDDIFPTTRTINTIKGLVNYPFTLATKNFELMVDAMKEQGHVEVLANPRISVMNGQPALISVGNDYKYIESIESKVSEGVISLSVNTGSVVSGLGMSVVATIMNDNEVIMHLTPVTSELLEEIKYEDIGTYGGKVGLPKVAVREMSSTVRVSSGEMLVIGGLIDSNSKSYGNNVAGIGEVPILDKIFGSGGNAYSKKEMVILLRPVILN
ncbi:MAG: hypothetical protein PF450_03900 [Bacteroidales bacterium]|nr:hypothetical protein [Bacteroidales bacterium]